MDPPLSRASPDAASVGAWRDARHRIPVVARDARDGECVDAEPGTERDSVSLSSRAVDRDRDRRGCCPSDGAAAAAGGTEPDGGCGDTRATRWDRLARRWLVVRRWSAAAGGARAAREGRRSRAWTNHCSTRQGSQGSGSVAAGNREVTAEGAPRCGAASAREGRGSGIRPRAAAGGVGSEVPRCG